MKKLVLIRLFLILFMLVLCQRLHSKTYCQNPIFKGFYLDSAICCTSGNYYMVTSTFEYFPLVFIFHGKDLVNWQQIGHVLDNSSQLNSDKIHPSEGIFTPTIRYHERTFYLINSLIKNKNNKAIKFYVTAKPLQAPWSESNWLENALDTERSLYLKLNDKQFA